MAKVRETASATGTNVDPLDEVEIMAPTRTRASGGGAGDATELVTRLLTSYRDPKWVAARAKLPTEWNSLPLQKFAAVVGWQYSPTLNVNSAKGALQVRFNKTNVDGATVVTKMSGPRKETGFHPTEKSQIFWKEIDYEVRQGQLNKSTPNTGDAEVTEDNGSNGADSEGDRDQ